MVLRWLVFEVTGVLLVCLVASRSSERISGVAAGLRSQARYRHLIASHAFHAQCTAKAVAKQTKVSPTQVLEARGFAGTVGDSVKQQVRLSA